jgi:hypothetical protein
VIRLPMPRSLRPVLAATGLPALLILVGSVGGAQQTPPAAAPPPRTVYQQYKNIRVLGSLPADQLIPLMRVYNSSLGVRCSFCHVVNPDRTGYERDDKPAKAMARKMIVMTRSLNAHQKLLENKATCFMCHHGHAEPDTQAPPYTPPPAPPAAGSR